MPSSDKQVVQIAVPLGVLIQKGLVLAADAYATPMLHYRRCDRGGGCYVEMLLSPDAVSALTTAAGPGKITVYADAGKAFEIPFSLKGLQRRPWRDAGPRPQEDAGQPAAGDARRSGAGRRRHTGPGTGSDSHAVALRLRSQ